MILQSEVIYRGALLSANFFKPKFPVTLYVERTKRMASRSSKLHGTM